MPRFGQFALFAVVFVFAAADLAADATWPTPPFVAKLANTAFESARKEDPKPSEALFCGFFSAGFLSGFTSPEAVLAVVNKADGYRAGHMAGQSYRKAHPERLATVLTEYGYIEVESTGLYSSSRIYSSFRPDEKEHRSTWCLDSLGPKWPAGSDEPQERTLLGPIYKIRLHVKGFLSPEGRKCGHDGENDRILLFTFIERAKE
jgi:hypothetical protein